MDSIEIITDALDPNKTLVQISEVNARFLLVGEIIERGGVLMRVVGKPIPDPMRIGRSQVVLMDLENEVGRYYPCSLHNDLMVPTYDEI